VTSQLLTVSNGDSDGLDGQFPTKQIYTLFTKDCSRFGCYPQWRTSGMNTLNRDTHTRGY